MKDNKKVLNEAFFKKETYADRLAKRMPQYEPIGNKEPEGVFAVTDAKEMKKRLAGTFGATFGDNNIRSMASKALKTFPILVSDNVEPETVISLKKLMEEQYADYISLLMSNQVIDLGAFETSNADGSTIAIQALDKISGTDFSKNRIANKAANSGDLTSDDVFANVPLYNLLREHNIDYKTGDALTDALFESAIIVPSDKVYSVEKYLFENAQNIADFNSMEDDLEALLEASEDDHDKQKGKEADKRIDTLDNVLLSYGKDQHTEDNFANSNNAIIARDTAADALRGFDGFDDRGNEVYHKLTNTNILIDRKQFEASMNRTIGEFLTDPKNAAIKDRFEKASILLEGEMITGSEFIDYCTMRLGLPLSMDVRRQLTTHFRRAKSLDRKGPKYQDNIFMSRSDLNKIIRNEKVYGGIMRKQMRFKLGSLLLAAGATGAVGGGAVAGAGLSGATLAGVSLLSFGPIALGVLAGCAVGAGAYIIYKAIRKAQEAKHNRIEGWERVEQLIDVLDKQRSEVISKFENKNNGRSTLAADLVNAKADEHHRENLKDYEKTINLVNGGKEKEDEPLSGEEIDKLIAERVSKYLNVPVGAVNLKESSEPNSPLTYDVNENHILNMLDFYGEIFNECEQDKDFRDLQLAEALATDLKMKTKYILKKPGKDVLIAPEFTSRSALAYGKTEIDPRLVKERKYNQPLLMTIKFRERFDDGKFSDNEMTAVIGILGKVIRVPSEEMKYILSSNAEGQGVIKGLLKGDINNTIADLLSTSKIDKDAKHLPQSAEIWNNLSKVSTLAAANKISGKKSNNIANAHIIFSEKEIDETRIETGVDYKREVKYAAQLMKHYSAFTLMIADDVAQRVYIFNDQDDISWNVVPFSAIIGKDTGDQLTAALAKLGRI